MKLPACIRILPYRYTLHFLPVLVFILCSYHAAAQCPPNIDFEKGNFTGWQCYTGRIVQDLGTVIVSPSAPTYNRHVLLTPQSGKDPYGDFPMSCPNGSGYSLKLGNDSTFRGAESVSYTFTIPPGQDVFNLIYNYAVVLEDPGHPQNQQPRLSIEVFNVTDNVKDLCSSFDFVISGSLPGFFLAPYRRVDTIPVRCKNWSAAFINLDGNAGKTFRISFTTTDCSQGGHFGYAYVDVNTICDGTDIGAIFCPDDKFVKLTAPPGFQNYKWFNSSHITLGTQQNLTLNPLPVPGDSVLVELTPYSGYGCVDTLKAYLWDTLTVTANAGPDREYCARTIVQLGENPRPGRIYTWSPATGLNDAAVSNPVASPLFTTKYLLTVTNAGGGCLITDTVTVVKRCDTVEFYVPAAFTPNGDGKNDYLRPVMYGFSKVNYFRVFNRYGQLLYNMNNDLPGWDGAIKGKPAGTQTVVWMIEAVDAYNRLHRRQGTSVLIR